MDGNIFKPCPLKLVSSFFVCLLSEIYWQVHISVSHVLLTGTVPLVISKKNFDIGEYIFTKTVSKTNLWIDMYYIEKATHLR